MWNRVMMSGLLVALCVVLVACPLLIRGSEGEGEGESLVGQVLFDNSNADPPGAGPTADTLAPLADARITKLVTWHQSATTPGTTAATISLKASNGFVYGPWTVTVTADAAGDIWSVTPDMVVPADTYGVVDSEPVTWLQNAASTNAGFTRIEGFELGEAGSGDIPAEGGRATVGGLTVTIPANALAAPVHFSVSTMDNPDPDAISPIFLLKGMPEAISEPFTLDIPLSRRPANRDEVCVQLGALYTADVSDDPAWTGPAIPATVSWNKVHVKIPSYDAASDGAAKEPEVKSFTVTTTEEMRVYIAALGNVDWKTIIVCPAKYLPDQAALDRMNLLCSQFTSAMAFTSLDLNMGLLQRTPGEPVLVKIDDYENARGAAFFSPIGRNWDYIKISPKILTSAADNSAEWGITALHELFHIFQYNYVPLSDEYPGNWIHEAASMWAERYYGALSYEPGKRSENSVLFQVNGLFNAKYTWALGPGDSRGDQTSSPREHGYCAGDFFFTLFFLDPPKVGKFWDELRLGKDLASAFASATQDPQWNAKWLTFARLPEYKRYWNNTLLTSDFFFRPASTDACLAGRTFARTMKPLSTVCYTFDINKFSSLTPLVSEYIVVRPQNLVPGVQILLMGEGTSTSADATSIVPINPGDTLGINTLKVTNHIVVVNSNLTEVPDCGARVDIGHYYSLSEIQQRKYITVNFSAATNPGSNYGYLSMGFASSQYNSPVQWNGTTFTCSGTYHEGDSIGWTNISWEITGEMQASAGYVKSFSFHWHEDWDWDSAGVEDDYIETTTLVAVYPYYYDPQPVDFTLKSLNPVPDTLVKATKTIHETSSGGISSDVSLTKTDIASLSQCTITFSDN